MDFVFQAEGLTKSYRNFKALDGLSMHVQGGAIYGFVGRNSRDMADARRRIGAVVETPALYTDMTAEDNLRQQCLILGLPSFGGIPDLLKLVGLENTGRKKVRHFSLGMKQRLGIALALSGDPDLLVLDPQGIVEIRELILKLNRERQVTFLISSHILDELSRLATHYGIIDHGRMVRELSAEELEAECRKCVRMEVSDTSVLARVLDGLHLDYKILSDTTADVYARVSVTELALALSAENCQVLSMQEKDQNLEGYFLSLVGGGAL